MHLRTNKRAITLLLISVDVRHIISELRALFHGIY